MVLLKTANQNTPKWDSDLRGSEPEPEPSQVRGRSAEAAAAAGGLDPGSAADRDGVLVTVQLRLRHHQAGVVLGAAMFDAWGRQDREGAWLTARGRG